MLPSAVSDSRVHNILPNKIETDFQFSRASAATRVNHQGLIEEVGYFGPELVQNGNFSELGSEEITNGDFSSASDWTITNNTGTETEIINGYVRIKTDGTYTQIRQFNVLSTGKTYKLVYDVIESDEGNLGLEIGGSTLLIPSTVGTHTFYWVSNSTTFNIKRYGGALDIKIDNVSVKQVDPDDDWVLKPDWGFVNNGVSITNATGGYNDSALYQLITLDSSKQYKATIDVSSISGSLQVYTGSFGAGFSISTAGEKSFILNLTSFGNRVNILPSASTSAVITSFSIVEVIGDKPRLDYDPLNPTCPHLLLEPQSINSFRFSEDFTQSYWQKQNGLTVSSNQTTSPEGIVNADKLVSANATNEQYIYNTTLISVISGDDVTISCFVKKLDYDYFQLRFTATGSVFTAASAWYNISNGTLGTIETGITAKIEDYGNGWYRCSATRTATGTGNGRVRLQLASADNTAFVTGDGTKGTFIYGAQFEIQSYPTSYIPTAGAAETRVAETCNNAGNANTFNSTEGVLYCEIQALASDSTNRYIALSDGSLSNRVNIFFDASNVLRGFVTGISSMPTSATITNFNKIALKYKSGDISLFLNGLEVATKTNSISLSGLNTVDFNNGGGSIFYGKVKSLATYNRALTDTELYTITSTQYSAYSGMVAALGNYTIPC